MDSSLLFLLSAIYSVVFLGVVTCPYLPKDMQMPERFALAACWPVATVVLIATGIRPLLKRGALWA